MADPDKIPETLTDTQATFDPSTEDVQPPEIMESSMVSESQDFHLVDSDDPDKETEDVEKSLPSNNAENCGSSDVASDPNQGPVEGAELQPAATTGKSAEISKNEKPAVTTESEEPKKKDDEEENAAVEAATTEDKEESKEEAENEDNNDFIQSSQQETLSPLKKQISGLTVLLPQKRKADDAAETQAKFPRTCSQEDALSDVRKKLDDEMNRVFEDDKERQADEEVLSNIVIPETQETTEGTESLQQVEQELEETLSQHPVEEEDHTSENEKAEDRHESKKATVEEKALSEGPEESKIATDKGIPTEPENSSPEVSGDANPEVPEKIVETSEISERSSKDDTKDDPVEITVSSVKSDDVEPNVDSRNSKHCFAAPTSSARTRMSIEVIYDRATAPPEKKPPRELVEIDEDGEKIVLDSSQEGCDKSMEKFENKIDTSYKTCASTDYKSIDSSKESSGNDQKSAFLLTNGSTESRIADSDLTVSVRNDLFSMDSSGEKKILQAQSPSKKLRVTPGKSLDSMEILNISDSEESFIVDERTKNKEPSSMSLNHDSSTIKTVPIEKELSILVKLKCLVYIEETTKEHVEKIITGVHCESASGEFSTSRHRNSDNSANLADISGNEKDASPGSVTSIPHPYQLNPRLSIASVASTSSSSSAGSLNAKIAAIKFQLPRGPAKHAKKITVTADSTSTEKRLENEEALEQIKKEWKNIDAVTCAVMNFANQELNSVEQHNGSTLRVDNSLERIRSSTPEVNEKDEKIVQSATPKRAAKRSRSGANVAIAKTTRAKNLRSSDTNGLAKDSPVVVVEKKTPSTSRKRKSSPDSSGTPSDRSIAPSNETINDEAEESLVGKQVFAKWSDNKYYPGKVTGKTKTKYRVNFYDGQNKLIIEDFIVPMPTTLNPGLSVYATSAEDDYGSCGIILEVKKVRDRVVYIVETDDSEKIEVDIKNIFLTNDQVQVLKEEVKIEMKSPPSTPKHLGKVTLENVIDGKRRSKRILTPAATTPKGKRGRASLQDKLVDLARPSASGISSSSGLKFDDGPPENTSDSNFSGNDDDPDSLGVQEEIIGTPYEQETKGPQSATKGKGRGKKKSETPEIIATLGPIPNQNSDLFAGLSFLLSCAPLNTMERYQARETSEEDSNSDPGTENEEEWSRVPFVRERLTAQLTAGGGKVYENFESIPPEEYENTKHITNVPNTTRKGLLCLSVGIETCHHQWVIRSCRQNKLVSPLEDQLPRGWSLLKKSYVEKFEWRLEQPFAVFPIIVVIPVTQTNKNFVSFWQKICENAGGAVLLVESPNDTLCAEDEIVDDAVYVVLTDRHCPSWIRKMAATAKIPIVSPSWIIECLVQGDLVKTNDHPRFQYNNTTRPSPHISHRKRR